jgi:hypothetical protein
VRSPENHCISALVPAVEPLQDVSTLPRNKISAHKIERDIRGHKRAKEQLLADSDLREIARTTS